MIRAIDEQVGPNGRVGVDDGSVLNEHSTAMMLIPFEVIDQNRDEYSRSLRLVAQTRAFAFAHPMSPAERP